MSSDPLNRARPAVEVRHLRYFLATAEELNYGRAANRLRIAQPGLSQQIKSLELLLGAQLFDRTRRTVKLTRAGQVLESEARKVLTQLDHALLAVRRIARGEHGRVAIGYVGSAAYTGMLTTLIGGFRSAYPEVTVDIQEMPMLQQLEQISEGQLDIGFIRPPVSLPFGVGCVPVFQEEILLALPENHGLSRHSAIPVEELQSETFIIPHHPPGVSFHKLTVMLCERAGFHPHIGHRAQDFMTILSMVSVGLGIALVPKSVKCISLPNVSYRSLEDLIPSVALAVAFRKSEPSPVARAFANHARRVGKTMRKAAAKNV